jgi:hypothetical protein
VLSRASNRVGRSERAVAWLGESDSAAPGPRGLYGVGCRRVVAESRAIRGACAVRYRHGRAQGASGPRKGSQAHL